MMDVESRGECSRKSSAASGFRLLLGDVCETVSVHSKQSVCKQKIDSMFDDSRSVMSQHLLNNPLEEEEDEDQEPRISNCVQARIERMFSDVVISSEDKNREKNDNGSNEFSVGFLGALFLPNKITNLEGLQGPLHKLYATADRAKKCTLDICQAGLRVREIGTNETRVSSFSSITVWSAVKYVIDAVNKTSAFLPLITDPDSLDKRKLFRPLIGSFTNTKPEPMFVVVMKPKTNSNKTLECHGFLCRTSEDSIVIAATLYRNLVSHMTSKSRQCEETENVNRKSLADESRKDNSSSKTNPAPKRGPNNKPVRPPRKKRPAPQPNKNGGYCTPVDAVHKRKLSTSNVKRGGKNASGEMDYSSIDYSTQQECSRHDKDRCKNNADHNTGDVFTRVAIPRRSTSFLNAGGMTRFQGMNQRRTALLSGTSGSPLGFSELFAEFRLQENLHSLDEILGVIINADGMSFNDLKPIYKEFLLKLAVTLTKDEMFHRSKSIMRKQKKRRSKGTASPNMRYFAKDDKNYPPSDGYKLRKLKSDSSNILIKSSCEESCETIPQIRNSSSGYVSCSECSYDSESCTCASADPCYCSLGYNATKNIGYDCDCDSDSCLDVDTKCYCKKITKQNMSRCSENALSVKKSEEIAALFANANFKQKPNVNHLNPNKSKRRNSSNSVPQDEPPLSRSWQSNVSLVDTLGYFP